MKIAVSDPGLWFAAFYVLAFLVTLAAVVIFSVRRRIELWPVLIMLTIMSMMTVLGSRLFTIPFSEWGRLIITGSFDGYSGRSAIGGLLFGLAGFVFSIRFLRIGMPVVNLFAWLTPIGFGIQKIGCFLNGCCYGEITSLPWGVRYSTGANAHFSQWSEGIIANDAAWSLPVHPVQLYDSFLLFVAAYIVWKSRHLWKRDGSMVVFALILFAFSRFITGFFRDPSTVLPGGGASPDAGMMQWIMLIAASFLALLLLFYERR